MKYCVLLCGLLLMQAVGLSAKERARLQADDVNISRSGDTRILQAEGRKIG